MRQTSTMNHTTGIRTILWDHHFSSGHKAVALSRLKWLAQWHMVKSQSWGFFCHQKLHAAIIVAVKPGLLLLWSFHIAPQFLDLIHHLAALSSANYVSPYLYCHCFCWGLDVLCSSPLPFDGILLLSQLLNKKQFPIPFSECHK